jgi:hypothetical protein
LKWCAYRIADWSQEDDPPLKNIVIYAVQLEPPYRKFIVSDYIYMLNADSWIWSPKEGKFIWVDARGIWISDLEEQTNRLLVAQEPDVPGSINPRPEWSSSGRYLFARAPGSIEGSAIAVLDTVTGRVEEIGETWRYVTPAAEPGWIKDDRLFVVYPGDFYEGKYPLIGRVWRVNPEGISMFTLEVEFAIENVDARFIPYAPTQLGDGDLAFIVRGSGVCSQSEADMISAPADRWDSGLYFVSLEDLRSSRANILPKGCIEIINWTPDGSGLLVRNWEDNTYIYIPADGSPLWDITSFLGDGACCFEWLP